MIRFFKRIHTFITPSKPKEEPPPTMVTGETLADSFRDTWALSFSAELCDKTKTASEQSRVYAEGFCAGVQRRVRACEITVCANTTFAEAKRYIGDGRVAVLNFANPVNPGGGVLLGAIAQEECLCRSSNLYACLVAEHLRQDYYGYHQHRHYQYSDRLIYSRDVTVFKDDALVPRMLSAKDRFDVDVITCAAPYLGNVENVDPLALTALFKSRIKNVLEAALDNNVDTIVLGAFGCGAFKNPPRVVAQAFRAVLEEGAYRNAFKHIVFAIKKESEENCGENFRVFAETFGVKSASACDDGRGVLRYAPFRYSQRGRRGKTPPADGG